MRVTTRPITAILLFVWAGVVPGCGIFFVFNPDEPDPLSASLRADRYTLFRTPSWANQTALRVLPIGGQAPYTYHWTVVGPNGRVNNECIVANQNVANFTATGGDGTYEIRCVVQDARNMRYTATTVIQVGGDIGLEIIPQRVGVRAGGGPHGQTTLQLNPQFGVPPFRVSWVCTGPDGKPDNNRLNVSNPMVPRFTSSDQVGRYILTATIIDAQGSTATQSFIVVVGQDLGLDVAVDRTTVLPGGGRNGMARLVATPIGGTEPYRFDWEILDSEGRLRTDLLWDAHSDSPIFESDDQTGTFLARCAVTDGEGTVLIGSTSLVVGEQITLDVFADRLVLPVGADADQQAKLTADVRGGHGDVTVTWQVTGPDGEDASALLSAVTGTAVVFTPGDVPGSHVVRCTAVDANGMSAADSLTLFVGGTLGVVVSTSNPWPATGGVIPTGTAHLSTRVYGGVPPYTYQWSVTDPAGAEDASRLNDLTIADPTFTSSFLAGRYFVVCTVTDSLGEVAADGILLNVGQPLNVDVSTDKQSLTGGGGVSGQAQLITTVHGGVAPYQFRWELFDPQGNLAPDRLSDTMIAGPVFTSDLNTGTYRAKLTTTDAMGTVFVDSLELVVGSTGGGAAGQNLSVSVSATRQTLASGGETATLEALTTGGVPPITYTWKVTDPAGNPADDRLDSTTSDVAVFTSEITQGTYRLRCTVLDAVGNTFTDSVQLTVSDEFHVDLTGSESHLVPGGSVTLIANRTGGYGPFTYSWTAVDASGALAGDFVVGSTGTGGALTAGVDDVTNIWQAPSGLAAMGSYRLTVTATDSAGRSFTDSMTVVVDDRMIVELTADRVHLRPGQSIALTADRTGGSANFAYTWTCRNAAGSFAGAFTSGSTGTGQAFHTAADDIVNTWTAPGAGPGTLGTYRITVSVVDANGITATHTLMVVVDEPFSLDVRASDAAIAAGGTTTLTADRTGGERNFSYAWSARNSLGALAGSFSSGSTGTGTATQDNRPNDATNVWTAPAGIRDTYIITCVATDALGRSFTDHTQVRVGSDDAFLLSLASSEVYVLPGETVTLTADAQNGVANFTYAWTALNEADNPAGTLSAAIQSGVPGDATNTWTAPVPGPGVLGTYRILAIVTDGLGRQTSDTIHVIVHSPLSLDLRAGQTLVVPSEPVTLTADPLGGEPPYDYVWQAFDETGAPVGTFVTGATGVGAASQADMAADAANTWSVATEGTYTIVCTVTDNAGQSFTDSVSVIVSIQQTLLVDVSVEQLSLAPGETVELFAKHIGGTANYNYAWQVVDESGAPAGILGAANQNGLAGDATNTWTAPADDGTYRITCTVTDFHGRRAADTALVRVSSLAVQNLFLAPLANSVILPEQALTWTALGADPGNQFVAAQGLINPAHPRNVVVTIRDGDDSISGGFVRVTGLDARGFPQSEVITIPGTLGTISTTAGVKPFATVHQVDAFGFTGTINIFGQVDTIEIGVGDKFGLTGLLRVADDVPYVYEGGTVYTSGFLLDLTPGQQGIRFVTPPDGLRNYSVIFRAR